MEYELIQEISLTGSRTHWSLFRVTWQSPSGARTNCRKPPSEERGLFRTCRQECMRPLTSAQTIERRSDTVRCPHKATTGIDSAIYSVKRLIALLREYRASPNSVLIFIKELFQ